MLAKSSKYNSVVLKDLGAFKRNGLRILQAFSEAIQVQRQVPQEIKWLHENKLPGEHIATITKYLHKVTASFYL